MKHGTVFFMIPAQYNEQEVLSTIDKVCKRLVHKFKFGYHDANDMKQEATIIALKSLNKWDGVRPLENFLYMCVHNGLFNFKRKHFQRPDKPCTTCPFFDPNRLCSNNECTSFSDKYDCTLYKVWMDRNDAKKNIVLPTDITNIRDEHEDNMKLGDNTESVQHQELFTIIDKYLDVKLRADYIKMRNNIKIPKNKRLKVEEAIRDIMREHYES